MRQTKYFEVDPDKMIDVDRKLGYNQKFLTAVKKIREDFKIPKRESTTIRERIAIMEDSRLIKKSEQLAKQFKLPETWADLVLGYIFYDKFILWYDPDGVSLDIEQKSKKSEKEFYLRIFPHTSLKEIKKAWPQIRERVNPDNKKFKKKTYKKIYRDAEVYLLHLEGKSVAQIDTLIKEGFPTEDLDHGNIKMIIKNFGKIVDGEK